MALWKEQQRVEAWRRTSPRHGCDSIATELLCLFTSQMCVLKIHNARHAVPTTSPSRRPSWHVVTTRVASTKSTRWNLPCAASCHTYPLKDSSQRSLQDLAGFPMVSSLAFPRSPPAQPPCQYPHIGHRFSEGDVDDTACHRGSEDMAGGGEARL